MRRSGLTPIIATAILTVIAIAMAASTITFVQTQQTAIQQELTTALDEELDIEEFSCQGRRISIYFVNSRDQPIESATARVTVAHDGGINYSLSPGETTVRGDFLLAGGEGYFNVSTDAAFRSGEYYRIRFDFGSTVINRLCRAGADWWELDWRYRRVVPVQKTGSGLETVNRSLDFPETMLTEAGVRSCSSIRMVEDGSVTPYTVASCPDMDDGDTGDFGTVHFLTTINGSRTEYDTYLYYGNIDVSHPSFPEAIGPGPVARLGPIERR